jgi:hypothetical protein
MENNPKKSKALIITIILIIILILVGFFLLKNRDVTSTSSGLISRIFAPLLPSNNSEKVTAQAGEDLNKGEKVCVASNDSNGNPIVMKVDNNGVCPSKVLGTATQNINNGDFGEIVMDTSGGSNGFLNSFSIFINDLFGNGDITPPDGGDITPPGDEDITPPDGIVFQCGDKLDNDTDNKIDIEDPQCHIDGDLLKNYAPLHNDESNFQTTLYQCNDGVDNDKDGLIDTLDRGCHIDWDLEKLYIPTHNYELNLGGTTGDNLPDLTAGIIKPTSTTIDTPTTISSIITNDGDASTVVGFTTLFTIKKDSEVIDEEETEGDPISKSSFKNLLVKIIDIIPWVSSANAAVSVNNNINPTPNPVPVPIPGTFNFTTSIPILEAQTGNLATISYTFTSTGTYSIRACADKNSSANQGMIEESNEENNCGPWTTLTVTGSLPPPGELPQCSDGKDNDKDDYIDIEDPECHLDGDLAKEYVSDHNSESKQPTGDTGVYECNDGDDNDDDKLIDRKDPECHLDGDLAKEYVSIHDNESNSPESGNEINKCKLIEQNPLKFTPEEEARLAVLLRKFYLVSSTLRTEDDITTIYNEIDQQKNFISQISELTNQCYVQYDQVKAKGGGTDWVRRGNPWYRTEAEKSNPGTYPYGSEGYSKTNPLEERILNIW